MVFFNVFYDVMEKFELVFMSYYDIDDVGNIMCEMCECFGLFLVGWCGGL